MTTPETAAAPTTVVAIATYRRPQGLADLLTSLPAGVGRAAARVVVVDNDPDGTAEPVARSPLDLDYVVEPAPGIAAARNRALAALSSGDDYLAFVDDDEVVTPGWLEHLLDTAVAHRADVVVGPVVPVLPGDAPAWVARGRFFDRPHGATGTAVRWPATNNVLIARRALDLLDDATFDEGWSSTGGSDTEFFERLRAAGARIVWCAEAVVHETVPHSRLTARWLWRRGVRLGNVSARTKRHRYPAGVLALVGVGRIGYGTLMLLAHLVTLRAPRGAHVMHIPKGLGMLGAITGSLVHEYAR